MADIEFNIAVEQDRVKEVMAKFEAYKRAVLKDSLFAYLNHDMCGRMYDLLDLSNDGIVSNTLLSKIEEWMEDVDSITDSDEYKSLKKSIQSIAKMVTEMGLDYDVRSDRLSYGED